MSTPAESTQVMADIMGGFIALAKDMESFFGEQEKELHDLSKRVLHGSSQKGKGKVITKYMYIHHIYPSTSLVCSVALTYIKCISC